MSKLVVYYKLNYFAKKKKEEKTFVQVKLS